MEGSRGPVGFLRIVCALLMALHGLARIWLGTVDDFGVFLDLRGFPMGFILAWFLTLGELLGALLLVVGRFVRFVCAYFIFQLLMGVVMVHFAEGWFVVGAGRNGMEYSVLLVCCFFALGWQDWHVHKQSPHGM